ncbi:ubiquitin carboxyl-terminal hydrolase 37 isoform X3 [Xenopus laevis]|uniref:Ubiquitin carboxyl-terminal hydrolase n=1 Tax=Xenopus laevis TaxID=8355 RepID=A0A8J0TXA6_XENLA|nr:ubiquitin carboxyl-terminal hydrolase 37 isoform X3 [Xenopus laevis]
MALHSLHGPIRINCLKVGTSKWKEGCCEVIEKDNKYSLVVNYNAGGGPTKFQLTQNIKTIVLKPSGCTQSRLMLTLKDASSLTIDKVPLNKAENLKHFLEGLDKASTVKSTQGSGSFSGVLGNRSTQIEANRSLLNKTQTPSKRVSFDNKDETPVKKSLSNTGRVSIKTSPGNTVSAGRSAINTTPSTPQRTSLMESRSEKRKRIQTPSPEIVEDYPKENDSSTTNKALSDAGRRFLSSSREKQLSLKQTEENRQGLMPLQSSSFYSSRLMPKDFTTSNAYSDSRSSASSQPPPAKRSLVLPSQPSPLSVKKLKPNQDYPGWNKQRVLSTHPQPQQLQGFSNLGNTCYMNAILQSLFSLQPFSHDLLKQGIPYRKIPPNALIRRFAHLLAKKDICSPEVKKDLLKKVKSAISATAERFSGYMQNDAHEFLSQCLDQLKEDTGKLNKTWKNELSSGDDVPGVKANDDLSSHIYTCPVTCNFEFEVQHSIICKMCGETVNKREQFNDLSIDLPRRKKPLPSRSIQDSLDLFFRLEDLDYACEKCSGKSATVMHKFSRLPRILILHLKRYSFNVILSLNNKVGQQVVIPRYLTLSSHCTESTRVPLSLGWNAQTALNARPLKLSQMANSCTMSTSTPLRKHMFKAANSMPVCLDSESEDEQIKRCVSHSQRVCDLEMREQQNEDKDKDASKCSEAGDACFDEMNDEELVAAVLEMSKKETSLSESRDDEDKLSSSPDTGFGGDDDVQEMAENHEPLEDDRLKTAKEMGVLQYSDMAKDFDENKENKTPEASQNDVDWLQYDLERQREEQELQQALAQSLQEQEAREMKEDDDLKMATELSLQEFNNTLMDGMVSDDDSGNEEVLDMEYTEAETEELKKNAETGDLPHSYRLISVVSHIGSTSSSGHYISDVYDIRKQAWFTYNDLEVSRTQETTVQNDRDRSGYIFFYMHKDVFDELVEEANKSQPVSTELNWPTRPPL